MKFFKSLWNKLKEPKPIWLCLFYFLFFICVALTIFAVCYNILPPLLSYILYAISALELTYFVYTFIKFCIPFFKKATINILKSQKLTNKMLEDDEYKLLVYSTIGFLINLIYVSFHLIIGILEKSIWYITISAYYTVLVITKLSVINNFKKHSTDLQKALKTYQNTGIMLNLLTLALSGIIVLIIKQNRSFIYAGLSIFAVAAYTFYKIISAIIQTIKVRNNSNLNIKSIRNINLVSAFYSILVLQVAMFQAFGNGNNYNIANALTGGIVSIIIFIISCTMLVKSYKLRSHTHIENHTDHFDK